MFTPKSSINFFINIFLNSFKISFQAVENIGEVTTFLEANKDNEDVKKFIGGFYSPDRLNPFFDTLEGLKVIQPRLDKYHNKGMETFKANTLPGLIDAEITKRNPGLTDEQKRIKKLEEDIANEKKANLRNNLLQTVTAKLSENKLPVKIAKYLIGEDEASSLNNVNEIKAELDKMVEDAVKEVMKTNGRSFKKSNEGLKKPNELMNNILRS